MSGSTGTTIPKHPADVRTITVHRADLSYETAAESTGDPNLWVAPEVDRMCYDDDEDGTQVFSFEFTGYWVVVHGPSGRLVNVSLLDPLQRVGSARLLASRLVGVADWSLPAEQIRQDREASDRVRAIVREVAAAEAARAAR
ncbi:MAG TPA: hypothetical protein VGJ13_04905 [Pseudonocardiaceae bacterium]|jgi:hypothetical protein